ncbi:hypothetical protein BGX21_007934 [Mortierella sp. AD011]|nr:hypothetical protein BGX20_009666 [Mortierella sp. AD010]KAF9402944.1 hypothetical protein BGX21_007934 [Mortierella sp. AD011]
MASFMSMQYASDSDSADDLDFEPASEASSCSDGSSGTDNEDGIEEIEGDDEPMVENSTIALATASSRKAPKTKKASSMSVSGTESVAATSETITADARTAAVPTVVSANPAAPGEVVKKKKGPKKGTKYKKRTPAADGSKPGTKSTKAPKMTKKAAAAAAAAAASEAARASQPSFSLAGRFGFQNTQVDLDHPLETFKWPYSPFTAEFKSQHQARDRMANELHQAVQQITDTNNRATHHLQELDNQLQMSRQDLRTSLDEIQFRKSQLRDMSLLAVDIVRKLSLPRPRPPPRRSSSSSASGNESAGGDGTGGYASSYQTTASHLDGDHMDVDGAESGGEYKPYDDQHDQQSLKGLNEGNVRSFLERIRALEQTQRQVLA